MLGLALVLIVLPASVFLLVKFAKADGDFTLLSRGPPKREEIEDKVVWITGASRGIGEDLAKQFAGLGARLILSARNVAELERVKGELSGKNAPHGVEILPLDLASTEESLCEAVKKAESFFSGAGVDYMVHNAAYERPKSRALDVTTEGLQATFQVNVMGTITLTRLLAPFMLERKRGHFIVMSSAAGKNPAPGQAVYAATKFALGGYFHTLRSELCQNGIKVTVICPGPIDTSRSSGATEPQQSTLSENRVSSERCARLSIIAATHGLKEAWISKQPVLLVMYLAQYAPSVAFWLLDKIGAKRIEAAANKKSTYSWNLILGKNKSA
ncbi:NAD(P)-binding Rossmann-fold superfamily protein [Wolffia australiana]